MGLIMPGRGAQHGSPRNALSLRNEARHDSLLILVTADLGEMD